MGRAKGQGPKRLACGRIARLGVLAGAWAAACLALGGCASSTIASKETKFSKRLVEEGEAIPKGGGNYKVGQPYTLNGRTYTPAENPQYRADGIASWYGPDFHGRETANGEVYDMHAITAAHPTLPIPSYARVTNLENGRSIIVRVNDRGPYVGDRLIDLSIGASKALDYYSKGLARVRVEYVGRAPLEGTDDKLLMATLRQGTPAPVPSLVRVAADKPLLPASGSNREGRLGQGVGQGVGQRGGQLAAAPLPVERPYGLGAAPGREPARGSMTQAALTERKPPAPARSSARPEPSVTVVPVRAAEPAPTSSYAPARGEGVGLMSGRGLY